MTAASAQRWPELPYAVWKDTCDTLHLWTQVVGKIRLALTPWMNHSWHVALYVTARGLTTSPIPYSDAAFHSGRVRRLTNCALSPDLRTAYMTGAYDSLVGYVATPEEAMMAKHYVDCLLRARMTNTQLSENVREYAAPRPKFHGSTPQDALVNYLIELCGSPPGT